MVDQERTYWFMRHVLPHEPALRAWLSSRRSAFIDVDDVIQEAYAILAARQSVNDICHPRAYLFQVARSVVIRHARRARVVPIQLTDDLEQLDVADWASSPERTAIAGDDLRSLAEAIAAMPGQTRAAFILQRVQGLSYREIAEQMRLSERTIEKHIARGLRFLIDWFGRGTQGGAQPAGKTTQGMEVHDGRARIKSEH